jgi:phosphoribosylformylglycinamidine cyclo-ligase
MPVELGGQTIADALLAVHRSYLQPIQTLVESGLVRGFSHVTGGGIEGNTSRILPDALGLDVDYDAWERPALFRLIQQLGDVPEADAREAFNLGIGLVAVVAEQDADEAERVWREAGEEPVRMGRVVPA